MTESIDVMPTILEWLGGDRPRACDGRSLVPLVEGSIPVDWRTELHYEYDFRDVHYSAPNSYLELPFDQASLCVVQDADYKYIHFAALPPLFFDLKADPNQFVNRANDPAYAERVLEYAQRALSWRLIHAEKTLTHYRSGPRGLQRREPDGTPVDLRLLPSSQNRKHGDDNESPQPSWRSWPCCRRCEHTCAAPLRAAPSYVSGLLTPNWFNTSSVRRRDRTRKRL
ncbi:MAG TPA: sulfatase/phosphatase domain-containing protein [Devosiaceae bacterium]|nr:sulfatase/phosphatase domain-containing protein [Devosiaceae bacterium]